MDKNKKATRILNITIDTNCINVKQAIKELNQLEAFDKKGVVKIVKTDVMDTEFLDDKGNDADKRKAKAAKLPEDIGIAVFGHSRFDHMKFASEETTKEQNEIIEIVFQKPATQLTKQQRRDTMHLHTHLINHSDIFVTTDCKHIWGKRVELKDRFGIVVAKPAECIQYIKKYIETGCYK